MNKLPYLTKLIKKSARKIGAKVIIEPSWGFVSQIVYKNGVVRSFFHHFLDLNNLASSEISGDKGYAKFFMSKKGYRVAEGTTVFSDAWAQTIKSDKKISYGIKYAKKLGYPLIIKPNSKSQGMDVYAVLNQKELVSGLREIFKKDKIAILEKYLPGKDYRIVTLEDKVLYAYERIPLSVTGDGKHSILELLSRKKIILRKKNVKINPNDGRIKLKLRHQGLSLKSIPSKNEKIYLLDNANLSSGGEAIDVTKSIHPDFKKIAIKLTRDMGLRICGVDIMLTKGDISENPQKCEYYIIEINSAIGIEPIESTYLTILKALGKKD